MAFTPFPIVQTAVEYRGVTPILSAPATIRFATATYPYAFFDYGETGLNWDLSGYSLWRLENGADITEYTVGILSPFRQTIYHFDGVEVFSAKGDNPEDAGWEYITTTAGLGSPLDSILSATAPIPAGISYNECQKVYTGVGGATLNLWGSLQLDDSRIISIIETGPLGSVLTPNVGIIDGADWNNTGFNITSSVARIIGGFIYVANGDRGTFAKVAIDGSGLELFELAYDNPDFFINGNGCLGASDTEFYYQNFKPNGKQVILAVNLETGEYRQIEFPEFDFDAGYITGWTFDPAIPNYLATTNDYDSGNSALAFVGEVAPPGGVTALNLKIGDGIKLPCYSPCIPLIIKEDFSL